MSFHQADPAFQLEPELNRRSQRSKGSFLLLNLLAGMMAHHFASVTTLVQAEEAYQRQKARLIQQFWVSSSVRETSLLLKRMARRKQGRRRYWVRPALGQSLLTFGPEFHMCTCMHAFATLTASHHMVKVHDVTAKHCALH